MNFFLVALIIFGSLIAGTVIMAGLMWCVTKYNTWMEKSAFRVVASILTVLIAISLLLAWHFT